MRYFMTEKSWAGRFSEKTDRSVEDFTASIDSDKRLYPYDIEGSIAHCRTLAKTDIISQKQAELLIEGLGKIKQELERGEFEFDNALEDIHMHIEARLVQHTGEVAHKLHTARSRNDQVALDLRLYLRDETSNLFRRLLVLQQVLLEMAKDNLDTIMPGYTHLQRAQPVLFSHHLMAYYEMFNRDMDRLRDGLKRINVMPLGSAAVSGTTYPIDREYTARLLEFPKISSNSMDAVSDRDFIIEFLSSASICMVHLSRLAEELVLWSSAEFNFIELPDAFATGSSIMPQKKNPDVAELVRAKAGRVFGSLLAMLTVMKSLPLSYNRDLQEDKDILFSAVDTLAACLDSTIKLLPRLKINKKTMALAASTGFLNATDMADYLVAKGVSFRKAHRCVGQVIGYALKKKKELHELSLKELRSFSALFEEDIFDALSVQQMISRRKVFGGTAAESVLAAIRRAQEDIDSLK